MPTTVTAYAALVLSPVCVETALEAACVVYAPVPEVVYLSWEDDESELWWITRAIPAQGPPVVAVLAYFVALTAVCGSRAFWVGVR